MSYVVIVCGSRNWRDRKAIFRRLKELPEDTVVYHGDNGYDKDGKPLWGRPDWLAVRGADKVAGAAARYLGFTVIPVTPEWERYGKAAGPRRNEKMLHLANPDCVIAFHDDISKSAGTGHMVRIAREQGVPVEIITNEMPEWYVAKEK